MDEIVALCRRRGFIFQSSEIYGGINGFWDYGPLGTQLKRNLKDAWWRDVVQGEATGPDGQGVQVVGVDCTIIMNPRVWEASGHVGGFNDPMVDCRESKARYRADHLVALGAIEAGARLFVTVEGDASQREKAVKALLKYERRDELDLARHVVRPFTQLTAEERARAVGPDAKEPGTLTEPRQFNLMFKTNVGAVEDPSNIAYLRPETAQGIFANFER